MIDKRKGNLEALIAALKERQVDYGSNKNRNN